MKTTPVNKKAIDHIINIQQATANNFTERIMMIMIFNVWYDIDIYEVSISETKKLL